MFCKTLMILMLFGMGSLTNALFFGLFSSSSSSRTTPKPDVIVRESPKPQNDRIAYENYLRSLANIYSAPSVYPSVQYVPVYTYQPQHTSFVSKNQNYLQAYPFETTQTIQHEANPVQQKFTFQPYKTSGQFQSPIVVLPSGLNQKTDLNSQEVHQSQNTIIIEEPATEEVISQVKTFENKIPEPQISTSLEDLPLVGNSPDFRTGAYVSKTRSPSEKSDKRVEQRFGHSYSSGDGTKVFEDGKLVRNEKGQETVIRHGQYEYIDASGKPVLVKWVADDDGYRLV